MSYEVIEVNTFPKPLTEAEEKHYLALLKEENSKTAGQEAKKILIERNLRLVAHIARKYQSQEEEFEDLISVGTIGLIKAIDSYDYSKGSKLVTYAARCIENELLMLFRSRRKSSREISLYEPLGTDKEGNEISLLDICEKQQEEIDSRLEREYVYSRLFALMQDVLDRRELEIIGMRYGFGDYEEMTQREIGRRLGISRSYVSRIEKKALQKLKKIYDL